MANHPIQDPHNSNNNTSAFLWAAAFVFFVAMIFARAVYPELLWLTAVVGVPLVASLGALIRQNSKALKGRSAAYGLNSAITVLLVIALIGVVNFLGHRYPQKLDLTKNKVHTLSDQTDKLIKGLKSDVKVIYFAKLQGKEQIRPLLDNYKSLNPKFDVEYVDPDREPTRAKEAGIKKFNTLQLKAAGRESKIEEPTEEKLTNALIKLTKEKVPTVCSITGHGEKSFGSTDADGYDTVKKGLADQSYQTKDVNLVSDAQNGKMPDTCDAIVIAGPQKAFFPPEVTAIRDYLANGGRAIIAVDLNIKGDEYSPELTTILAEWNLKAGNAMVVDPLSKMLGVDASVPILATYNKEQAIVKDFQAQCYFPFARPVEAAGNAATGVTPVWMAQTTPKSWAVTDLKQLASGQVKFTEGKDRNGPLTAAIAVDGKLKDSKATRNTRIVLFGSSMFATNNYQRFGGNLDLMLNSAAWVLEDESLISIRAKESDAGKVELSQKQGTVIFLLTVFVIPLVIAVGGIVIWVLRRRL
jgi:ABC-type uncharacterized transport system involved in gliding motility auxiliary subunit